MSRSMAASSTFKRFAFGSNHYFSISLRNFPEPRTTDNVRLVMAERSAIAPPQTVQSQTIERESFLAEIIQTNNTAMNSKTFVSVVEAAPSSQKESLNEINSRIAVAKAIESGDKIVLIQRELEKSLHRIRLLERETRSIPKLQTDLDREKADNRELVSKLRSLELALQREKEKELEREKSASKPFSSQRVSAVSLENLNFSTHLTRLSAARKSGELAPLPVSKREIGCMTQSPLRRDIGIQSETKAEPIEPRKPLSVSVGVQSEAEKKIPRRHVATSTDAVAKPTTRSIGVAAAPMTREKSCAASPDVRTVGTENIFEKIRTRNASTEPMTDAAVAEPMAALSLKSLGALSAEKSKYATSSTGSQTSRTNTATKSCQCDSVQPQRQIASTDTSDLIIKMHRGVATDFRETLKFDRTTNTERTLLSEKATNTAAVAEKVLVHTATEPLSVAKQTADSATECSQTFEEIVSEAVEMEMKRLESKRKQETVETTSTKTETETKHQCNNCLAKIEIKQQTIIKNPKTMHVQQAKDESAAAKDDASSRIPRPTALISPRPERHFIRQDTYTLPLPTIGAEPAFQCPVEALLR